MLSSLIDAFEWRHVVTIDIKEAFFKAKVPEDLELIVKMEGEMAELMCKIYSRVQQNKYKKFHRVS
jgi:hypothetical protein